MLISLYQLIRQTDRTVFSKFFLSESRCPFLQNPFTLIVPKPFSCLGIVNLDCIASYLELPSGDQFWRTSCEKKWLEVNRIWNVKHFLIYCKLFSHCVNEAYGSSRLTGLYIWIHGGVLSFLTDRIKEEWFNLKISYWYCYDYWKTWRI